VIHNPWLVITGPWSAVNEMGQVLGKNLLRWHLHIGGNRKQTSPECRLCKAIIINCKCSRDLRSLYVYLTVYDIFPDARRLTNLASCLEPMNILASDRFHNGTNDLWMDFIVGRLDCKNKRNLTKTRPPICRNATMCANCFISWILGAVQNNAKKFQ